MAGASFDAVIGLMVVVGEGNFQWLRRYLEGLRWDFDSDGSVTATGHWI